MKSTATRKAASVAPRFAGKTFVLAGAFVYPSGADLQELIRAEGGGIVSDVGPALDYVLAGERRGGKPSAAEKKAGHLNKNKGASIQVLGVGDLYALACPSREEALALLRGGQEAHWRWDRLRKHSPPALDLSGADLRGANLSMAELAGVKLRGADLREADMSYTTVEGLADVRADRARFELATLSKVSDSSFRNADLTHTGFHVSIERCDFTGAKMSKALLFDVVASEVVFANADLRDAGLSDARLAGADFTGAKLDRALAHDCDLGGAVLARVSLRGANLVRARLAGADLRKADLRGANLCDADLTDARIQGANFGGANLTGAKLGGASFAGAKGLTLDRPAGAGKVGPKLLELEGVAGQFEYLWTTAELEGAAGITKLMVCTRAGALTTAHLSGPRITESSKAKALGAAMVELARLGAHETLQLSAVSVKSSRGPLGNKRLKELAQAAWGEAFGVLGPSPEDVASEVQANAAELATRGERLLADLRAGAEGVVRWNAQSLRQRQLAGPFRGADLSGADLRGAQLGGLDFQGARFDKADLRKATLWQYGGTSNYKGASFQGANAKGADFSKTRCQGADFTSASLAGATFRRSSLQKANFAGADLREADLCGADLRGADLSSARLGGAELSRARYDEHTRFSPGALPPDGMVYAGETDNPHLAKQAEAAASGGPMDVDDFMLRMRATVETGRLTNALQMLRAERFQLFASVAPDHLVGIVRSQSSAARLYSCRLAANGAFSCCTQNLRACGGLHGRICKHLLVLIVGLVKSGQVDPALVSQWVKAARTQKPLLDADAMTATFLRYKGAEAGEIDWRPTETIPEDYYAL